MKRQNTTARDIAAGRIEYLELIARLRRTVPKDIPRGAQLLVVSRGDDDLLDIPGMTGHHFPQNQHGRYAGYNPADSDAAIEYLEHHRSAGASFLLFPATSLWWLDHYGGLLEHLDSHYRRVRRDADCAIYDLRLPGATGAEAEVDDGPGMEQEWRQIRGLVDALLPEDAGVVVATREWTDGIPLGVRPVHHILTAEILNLEDATPDYPSSSHQFLVIPKFSHSDVEEAAKAVRTLRRHYRLVACHKDACTVFDISPDARQHSLRRLASTADPIMSQTKRRG